MDKAEQGIPAQSLREGKADLDNRKYLAVGK